MLSVVAHQLRRHAFHFSTVEHIQKKRLKNIIAVVTKGDFSRAQFGGGAVENTATQARAQGAGGFPFRDFILHNPVGIFFDDLILNADAFQILRQNMFRETWLLLIEVHRHQAEANGRALLQIAQNFQHGIAVFAAREANHNPVAVFNHIEIGNGFADVTA